MAHDKKHKFFDVVIVGSGASGLSVALNLPTTCKVAVLAKSELNDTSTSKAQGGIATVMDNNDSLENHVKDTLIAGAGLCDEKAVRFVVNHAQEAINWLLNQGVNFSKITDEEGKTIFHLTKEGGHSHRRILHAKDATGNEIEEKLIHQVLQRKNITTFINYTGIDLVVKNARCCGLYVLNNLTQEVEVFSAKFMVLATGGASKVYLYTSNPDGASGDGIAMAYRRGCKISHMEFNQFHPTCLYHPQAKSFLISEAVRGEGGLLKLPNGERFMPKFDARAELAPRDIVARAIDYEMKRLGLDHVYLDISHKPAEFIQQHFPMIYQKCLEFGFDITKEPIPVVPASHYTCGGVVVDQKGRTTLDGLYAVGEVSCTGLHGANRMASNSLLECLVYGIATAKDIALQLNDFSDNTTQTLLDIPPWDASKVIDSDEEIVVTHNWSELRHIMWDYVGIVRTDKRLERAERRIDLLKKEIQDYYGNFRVTKNLLELRNLVVIAELIVKSAKQRKENIGLHYNLDNLGNLEKQNR